MFLKIIYFPRQVPMWMSISKWCEEQAEEQTKMFKYWNMVLQIELCELIFVRAMRK